MQNLPKNGSFVQRRKMYVFFPFHNLSSKIPIDWSPQDIITLEKQRVKEKQIQQQQYIKRTYNQKIEQKLKQKFSLGRQQNRATINKNMSKIDNINDTLTQQLDNFNQIKAASSYSQRNNPQIQANTKDAINYKQQSQIVSAPPSRTEFHQNNKQQPLSQSQYYQYSPQTHKQINNQYQTLTNSRQKYSGQIKEAYNIKIGPEDIISQRIPEKHQGQSTPKSYYGYDLREQYRKYAEMLPPEQAFRNVMPDKLENFLRQKTKADRKRSIKVDLSMDKRGL